MSRRRTDLEKQLEEVKKAEEYFAPLAALGDVKNLAVKAKLWDEIAPFIKLIVDERLKGAITDEKVLAVEVFNRAFRVVCGEEYRKHLEKL